MRRCICVLMFLLISFSFFCMADNLIDYGYDKVTSEIYAKSESEKGVMRFVEDLTGNPSYSFVFFSKAPAILADGRSLHDFTIYTTLKYTDNKFIIDCIYSNIKSKKNGLLIKKGECGLAIAQAEKYSDVINDRIDELENDMDSIDTSLILNGKRKYLSVILYHSNSKLIFKLYDSKKSLLIDNYSIVSLNRRGVCEVYANSPWVVYGKVGSAQIEIMEEVNFNGSVILNKAMPDDYQSNKCSTYPVTSVKQLKSYFYSPSHKARKSYLIKGDKVNLLKISDDDKWCEVEYFSEGNKSIRRTIHCEDLTF